MSRAQSLRMSVTCLASSLVAVPAVPAPALTASAAWARPPIVDGGENQMMYPGQTIVLQGTASDPVDGDTIAFWEWQITQGPAAARRAAAFDRIAHWDRQRRFGKSNSDGEDTGLLWRSGQCDSRQCWRFS